MRRCVRTGVERPRCRTALPVLAALVALAALPPVPTALSAQEPGGRGQCARAFGVSAAPGLFRDDGGSTRLGGRAAADACRAAHDLSRRLPFSWYARGGGSWVLVPRAVSVPQELGTGVSLGFSVSLSEPAPIDMDAPPDQLAEIGAAAWDYGFLGLGGHAAFESSAHGEERAMAGGVELRYGHPRPVVPSLVLSWDRVEPLESRSRRALGLPEDGYSRGVARAYWWLPMGRFLGEIDVSAFRAFGLPGLLEAAGWRDGAFAELSLGYGIGRTLFGPVALEAVVVRYAHGQAPTAPGAGAAWTLGLELGTTR